MGQENYLIKEAAKILRTGENTVRNLISDGRLRAMKMPTLIIPDFEIARFSREVLDSQEDLSRYADKSFQKKNKQERTSNIFNMG